MNIFSGFWSETPFLSGTLFIRDSEYMMCLLSSLGMSRIGDNKKVSQIEMLPDEQLLVLISGK